MYKYFISLGSCCAVANELLRFGLSDACYPFDWSVIDFKSVMYLINSNFDDFLNEKRLKQNVTRKHIYADEFRKIYLYHDFNAYQSLKEQMPAVREKYKRRIARFYESIKQPTLFFRYIYYKPSAGQSELSWIEDNIDHIRKSLRTFNADNDIIFIANEGLQSKKIKLYTVPHNAPIAKGEVVCRQFVNYNKALKSLLENIECENKEENLKFFWKKVHVSPEQRKLEGDLSANDYYIHPREYEHEMEMECLD